MIAPSPIAEPAAPMELECRHCGHVLILDARQQEAILAELTRPAQHKIIDCVCRRFQFALTAGPVRPRQAVCR